MRYLELWKNDIACYHSVSPVYYDMITHVSSNSYHILYID